MNQTKTRILIVEDEPKVASFVKRGLEENGFCPEIAYDGIVGKKMFDNGNYDLLILDVNLPYMNGLSLCKEIRSHNQKIPVLMLSALGATEDKLTGFESGADDYLSKPFEFRELIARIRALLKRTSNSEPEGRILKYEDLEMNLDTYEVRRNSRKIDLSQKEFTLLQYLLINKKRVVSRIDIAEKVWDVTFDTGTNVIDVYINFLRKKIDKDFSHKLIHTVLGVGYILKSGTE